MKNSTITAVWDFIDAINNNLIVVAIRRGLTLMIPFMIMGAFAVFVNNLPVGAYQQLMLSVFGERWKDFGAYIWQATFGIMSMCINLSIGYALTENRKDKSVDIHPMIGALVSLVCLFVLTDMSGDIMGWIGSLGVFVAIATAFTASKLHTALCGLKSFRIKLFSNAAENNFNMMLVSLVPVVCTVLVFVCIRVFLMTLGVEDIHASLYESLKKLFSAASSTFSAGIGFVTLTHISWFLGLHGNNVLEPVAQSVLVPAMETNAALAAQGLPPTEIFTKPFFDVFVFLGGSGATLSLIIALFIGSRRSNTRQIASISVLPALINVNEVVIFGIPIVLNFFLLIPFVLVPLITTLITYTAMRLGLVPLTTMPVEWTTPILIGGYVTTGGSVAGAVLQLVNLTVGTLIYLPFVSMYEKSLERDNKRTLQNLMSDVLKLSELRRTVLLDRKDAEGNMARALAGDLSNAMRGEKLELYYQPLTMDDGTLFGVEALLRWNHEQLGYIPPPVIIAVAEEAELINELGKWIFSTAIKALGDFKKQVNGNFVMSVNITPSQLDVPSFADDIVAIVNKYGQSPNEIDIEITEQAALGGISRMQAIQKCKGLGFNIAIDDFGMGHGSLAYIKDLQLDVIKIDGSIIKELETNASCRDIVNTIMRLCESKNIHVIAEYVETGQQRKILSGLGCRCYQGYLYSRALPYDETLEYVRKASGASHISMQS